MIMPALSGTQKGDLELLIGNEKVVVVPRRRKYWLGPVRSCSTCYYSVPLAITVFEPLEDDYGI